MSDLSDIEIIAKFYEVCGSERSNVDTQKRFFYWLNYKPGTIRKEHVINGFEIAVKKGNSSIIDLYEQKTKIYEALSPYLGEKKYLNDWARMCFKNNNRDAIISFFSIIKKKYNIQYTYENDFMYLKEDFFLYLKNSLIN